MRKGTLQGDFLRAAVLLVLVPSIAINVFVGLQTKNYIQRQMTAFTEDGLRYAEEDFGRLIEFVTFTRNQVIFQIVSSGILEHVSDRSLYGIDIVRSTVGAVNMTDLNSPYVDGIQVILGDRFKIASGYFSTVSSIDTIVEKREFSLDRNESVSRTSNGDFRYVMELENLPGKGARPVIIMLTIPAAIINGITERAAYAPSVRSMLVTATGEVLARSQKPRRSAGGTVTDGDKSPTDQELLGPGSFDGQRAAWSRTGYWLRSQKVRDLPLYLVSAVPLSLVSTELIRLSLVVVLTTMLVLAFSMGGAVIAAGRITRPLYSLLDSMDKVGRGDFSHRIASTGLRANEDLRRLTDDFNVMIDRVDLLVVNLKRQEKEANLSHVLALQAQINPHFLYNTLDLIRGLASWKQIKKVDETASALAELFRYSIDRRDEPVHLRDEFGSLSNYLKIQQLRFEDRFHASLSIDERAGECLVPRLILQPIVENAFRHGLEPALGPGSVAITASVSREGGDQELHIVVADTGVGMDPDTLRSVRLDLEDTRTTDSVVYGSGIGLRNVHRRIRMSFGPPFGVSVASDPGCGTRITVVLPVQR